MPQLKDNKVHILIVEDESIVAMGMEDTLQTAGYEVAAVADEGKAAIELVKSKPVDLVLLDIHIRGDWDGIETARQLNNIKQLPLIFLTAFSDRETIDLAKETNPSAYLIKPYQPKNLLVSIEMALHNFAFRRFSPETRPSLIPDEHTATAKTTESLLYFNDAVFIKQNYKFIKVNLKDIYYLETKGNYTHIITGDKKYMIRQALSVVLDKLDQPGFVRVHRSFAINIAHLDTFNEYYVVIGKKEIPLGRNYKETFLLRFNFL